MPLKRTNRKPDIKNKSAANQTDDISISGTVRSFEEVEDEETLEVGSGGIQLISLKMKAKPEDSYQRSTSRLARKPWRKWVGHGRFDLTNALTVSLMVTREKMSGVREKRSQF